MFLTQAELAELTARKQAAKQRDALDRMGIPFVTAADGRLRVARAAVEGVLCRNVGSVRIQPAPDEMALRRWQRGQAKDAG